jgi:hypothetical protein
MSPRELYSNIPVEHGPTIGQWLEARARERGTIEISNRILCMSVYMRNKSARTLSIMYAEKHALKRSD